MTASKEHKCDIRHCLYGCGHHVIDIGPGKLKGKEYPKVIQSIAICRQCGQTWKLAQFWSPNSIKEMKKKCTKEEYAYLWHEKFKKLGEKNHPRTKLVIEEYERAKELLDNKKENAE